MVIDCSPCSVLGENKKGRQSKEENTYYLQIYLCNDVKIIFFLMLNL